MKIKINDVSVRPVQAIQVISSRQKNAQKRKKKNYNEFASFEQILALEMEKVKEKVLKR